MTAQEARELLQYNPATGLFRWRDQSRRRIKKGWFAGSNHRLGYNRVTVMGKEYLAHRLAWIITHGEWPEHQIDHINHCRTDNRLCNLRHVTNKENHMNRIGKGYRKIGERFEARVNIDGVQKHLGRFDTAEEARAAYLNKKAELFPIGGVA